MVASATTAYDFRDSLGGRPECADCPSGRHLSRPDLLTRSGWIAGWRAILPHPARFVNCAFTSGGWHVAASPGFWRSHPGIVGPRSCRARGLHCWESLSAEVSTSSTPSKEHIAFVAV